MSLIFLVRTDEKQNQSKTTDGLLTGSRFDFHVFLSLQAVLSVFFVYRKPDLNHFFLPAVIIFYYILLPYFCSVGINYYIFMSSTWQLLREARSGLLFGQDLKIEICSAWTFLSVTRPRRSRYE